MSDSSFASVAFLYLPAASGAVSASDRVGNALTAVDNATVLADGSALTGYSLHLDGSGDWVSAVGTSLMNPGSGSFTIDFRFKCSGTSKAVLEYVTTSTVGWRLWTNSSGLLEFYMDSTLVKTSTVAVNDGSKHHCTIVRSGSTVYMFVDGALQGSSASSSIALTTTPPILSIGARVTSRNPGLDLPGDFDFVRISPGLARWTAGFTPPTATDLAAQYSQVLIESMQVSSSSARYATTPAASADYMTVSAASAGGYGMAATSGINLSTAQDAKLQRAGLAAENIQLSSAIAARGLFNGVGADAISLADGLASLMKSRVQVADSLRVFEAQTVAGLIDDALSVWVANVATAAHSRYEHYGFNSFARFNGKHYGCKSGGIYELDGTADGTAPIKWTVTFPETDFDSSNLKRFESIYIGAKTTGQIVLKVVQDAAHVYHYNVIPSGNESRTGRTVLGRGSVARYWQFELASDTQRAELDSIDYSFSIMSRRI